MKNKGFTITEIIIVLSIISLFSAIVVPKLLTLSKDFPSIEEQRQAQIVSIDYEGNKLWRVWDNGRFIYYMPDGETSWETGGKTNETVGVK